MPKGTVGKNIESNIDNVCASLKEDLKDGYLSQKNTWRCSWHSNKSFLIFGIAIQITIILTIYSLFFEQNSEKSEPPNILTNLLQQQKVIQKTLKSLQTKLNKTQKQRQVVSLQTEIQKTREQLALQQTKLDKTSLQWETKQKEFDKKISLLETKFENSQRQLTSQTAKLETTQLQLASQKLKGKEIVADLLALKTRSEINQQFLTELLRKKNLRVTIEEGLTSKDLQLNQLPKDKKTSFIQKEIIEQIVVELKEFLKKKSSIQETPSGHKYASSQKYISNPFYKKYPDTLTSSLDTLAKTPVDPEADINGPFTGGSKLAEDADTGIHLADLSLGSNANPNDPFSGGPTLAQGADTTGVNPFTGGSQLAQDADTGINDPFSNLPGADPLADITGKPDSE